MNKFIWFLVFIVYALISIRNLGEENTVKAAEYNAFSEVILEEGKLLANYTDEETEKYSNEVSGRKFMGWRTKTVNKEVKANFIEKTILEVTNEKEEVIDYKYSVTTQTEIRTVLDCSGSLKYEVKGDIKKFKNDLAASIGISYKSENTNVEKKTEEIKIPCEGNTKLLITLKGNGVVTNGVAAYYICWIRNQIGGFEYFTILHEFQSIEKFADET